MRQPNATDEQIRQEAARIVSSYDTVGPEGMPKEMNFGIYPILSLPLDEMVSDDRPYDTGTYRKCRFAKGSTCRIKTESTYGFYHTCQVYYQYDTYDDRSIEFGVIQGCSVISDSYDLSDAIEDARVAQSPEGRNGR